VDAWGSSDAGVRDILGPIEELFEREFPNFAPYPWDWRSWVNTHVRAILLAEPMVDDFGRCFAGVDPEEAERLAASFAFAACVRRTELADTLSGHLRPAG
jgi:hypothetical protein